MKRIVFIISVITLLLMSNRVIAQDITGQNDVSQNNGVFEMQAVYIPDFIAFKQVADKEFKKVDAYLVSGEKSAKPLFRRALKIGAGGWEISYIAGSEFRFLNFELPKTGSFEIEKIKIVADGIEMFYDISKSEWEMP